MLLGSRHDEHRATANGSLPDFPLQSSPVPVFCFPSSWSERNTRAHNRCSCCFWLKYLFILNAGLEVFVSYVDVSWDWNCQECRGRAARRVAGVRARGARRGEGEQVMDELPFDNCPIFTLVFLIFTFTVLLTPGLTWNTHTDQRVSDTVFKHLTRQKKFLTMEPRPAI